MEKSNDKLVKLIKRADGVIKKAGISDEKLKAEAFSFALRVLWDEEYNQKPKTNKE